MLKRKNQVNTPRKEVVMKIQILGSGCPKCKLLEEHARQAVAELGSTIEVEKVTNMETIIGMGVMMTPALVLDGTVKSMGRILTKDQIVTLLKGKNSRMPSDPLRETPE